MNITDFYVTQRETRKTYRTCIYSLRGLGWQQHVTCSYKNHSPCSKHISISLSARSQFIYCPCLAWQKKNNLTVWVEYLSVLQMEGFQSQSICHHLMKCWSATAEHSQKPSRNLIFLANSGVVRSYMATGAGWIETITICSHVVRNWTSISFKYNPSCWATTNPLLPPAGRQRYTTCVSKCGDLHFREQLSLLQLVLFFLLQLSHVAFLYQEQLLSDLVINALHLGTNTPPHVRASFRTLPTDHTNATITELIQS